MVVSVAEEAVVVGAEADLEAGVEVVGRTRVHQSRWVAVQGCRRDTLHTCLHTYMSSGLGFIPVGC